MVDITSVGSGIGRAAAFALARSGARVALLDVAQGSLAETEVDLRGTWHFAAPCDIADVGSIAEAFGSLFNHVGRIDVPAPDWLEIDDIFCDETMAVNANRIFFCARAAARAMGTGGGAIANLASLSDMIDWGSSLYLAS